MDINTALTNAELNRARAAKTASEHRMQTLGNRLSGDPKQIRKVAEDFEAVFLGQMLQHMWAGVGTDPTFGGGHGEDMFRPMMIDEFGKKIAATGGVGIANDLERQLLQLQEVK